MSGGENGGYSLACGTACVLQGYFDDDDDDDNDDSGDSSCFSFSSRVESRQNASSLCRKYAFDFDCFRCLSCVRMNNFGCVLILLPSSSFQNRTSKTVTVEFALQFFFRT